MCTAFNYEFSLLNELFRTSVSPHIPPPATHMREARDNRWCYIGISTCLHLLGMSVESNDFFIELKRYLGRKGDYTF